jgi:dihydroorotase
VSLRIGEIVKVPSPVDVHVHLREPGGEDQETIKSGSLAALAGGYQAVFDMPNNPNGQETWSEAKLDQKIEIGQASAQTNIGFYAGADLQNPGLEEFPGMVGKAAGLKLYMGQTTGNTHEHDLATARPVIDQWIRQARSLGVEAPILLHARSGVGAETAEYVARQGYPVHWCHLSTESEALASARLTTRYPTLFTSGVTLHALTMTRRNADFQQGWNGARMQPPLGEEADAEMLLSAYNNKTIQILETDHAPHTRAAKLSAEVANPRGQTEVGCTTCYGVSGIEFVLPIMTSLVQRQLTTMDRVMDSLYDQPIKMLRLKKVASTALANTTELLIKPHTIAESDIYGQSRNTPYVGWTAWAKVVSVRRAGTEVFDGKRAFSPPGGAKILRANSEL